jgi:MFS family permease
LLAISTTPVMILLVLPLAAVFRLVTSYLASLVAERVPSRFTAAAMGLLGAMEPLAQLVGAPIVTGLLEEFTRTDKVYHWVLPGSPFFFGASTYIIQSIVLLTIFRSYLNAAEAPGAPHPSKFVDEEATLLAPNKSGRSNKEGPVI